MEYITEKNRENSEMLQDPDSEETAQVESGKLFGLVYGLVESFEKIRDESEKIKNSF